MPRERASLNVLRQRAAMTAHLAGGINALVTYTATRIAHYGAHLSQTKFRQAAAAGERRAAAAAADANAHWLPATLRAAHVPSRANATCLTCCLPCT